MKNIVKEELKLNDLIIPFDEIPVAEINKDYGPCRLLKVIDRLPKYFTKAT